MTSKKGKSIFQKYSILLKIIAFTMLGIAGYIDLVHSNNSILSDPFMLGAFTMAIASVMTLFNPGVYYYHTAMFFFIFTKVVAQYTHSHHYDFWGHVRH